MQPSDRPTLLEHLAAGSIHTRLFRLDPMRFNRDPALSVGLHLAGAVLLGAAAALFLIASRAAGLWVLGGLVALRVTFNLLSGDGLTGATLRAVVGLPVGVLLTLETLARLVTPRRPPSAREWVENWFGNVRFRPTRVESPASRDELVRIVERAGREGHRVRAVGGNHSWDDAARTAGVLVSLDRLRRVLEIRPERGTVLVEAGITTQGLIEALDAHGLEPLDLPPSREFTLGGCVLTHTHGASLDSGFVADAMVGAELVTADGRVLDLARPEHAEVLAAVGHSLGQLGILYAVELRCRKKTFVAYRETVIREDVLVQTFTERYDAQAFRGLWAEWNPYLGDGVVMEYRALAEPPARLGKVGWRRLLTSRLGNLSLLLCARRTGRAAARLAALANRVHPAKPVAAAYHAVHTDLLAPRLVRHREIELMFPLADMARVVLALRDFHARRLATNPYRNFFPLMLRPVPSTAGDPALLRPFPGQDLFAVHAAVGPTEAGLRYLEDLLAEMHALGGCAHNAKHNRLNGKRTWFERIAPERLARFEAIRASLDPRGTFALSTTPQTVEVPAATTALGGERRPSRREREHWRGRRVVVTGASSGIGQGLADALLELGAELVLVSRQPRRAEHPAATWVVADLAHAAGVDAVYDFVIRRWGGLDALFNCAGDERVGPVLSVPEAELCAELDTNLRSPMLLCRKLAPHLVAQGRGDIINFASFVPFLNAPFLAGYAASKGGLLSFSESLGDELAPSGVHVLTAVIGTVRTPMMEHIQRSGSELAALMLRYAPKGDVGRAARVVLESAARRRRYVVYPRSYRAVTWYRGMGVGLTRWLVRMVPRFRDAFRRDLARDWGAARPPTTPAPEQPPTPQQRPEDQPPTGDARGL